MLSLRRYTDSSMIVGGRRFFRRGLVSGLVMGALAYGSVCWFIWATQIDQILAPLADLPSNPERMGMPYEKVTFAASQDGEASGSTLHAFWVPADHPDAPVFLYLHGQDATRGKNLEHTETFHECGYHVFIVDYRGFAETFEEEVPSEAKVYEDAEAALNYLKHVREIPASRIFIYGHSLGGAVAIELATRPAAEGTAGVIVENTFTSIRDMTRLQYYGLLQLLPIDLLLTERFDSLSKIAEVPLPMLLIHGQDDPRVPCEMSEALCRAAGAKAKLHLIEGAGHEDCCLVGKVEYRQFINDFVTRCLKPTAMNGEAADRSR